MFFEGQDLLDVVFFLLLVLSEEERCPSDLLLSALDLVEKFFVLLADRLNGVLQAFDLNASVSVVSQDVFLFNFKSPDCLLGAPLLIHELLVLRLEELVGVGALPKFLIDESVLPCQRLDILSQLSHFLRL